jgi:glycine betaine/proline transport system substrate-binding protein
MNSMLVYMAENQAEGADAAIEFLQSHEDVWKDWVGADMRIKIKNAL